jgi:hypothetical protein
MKVWGQSIFSHVPQQLASGGGEPTPCEYEGIWTARTLKASSS